MSKCGIYLIRNNRNNLVYIGQSIHIEQQIQQHFSQNNKGKVLIDSAIAEHPEDFSWEILQECPREELNYWEDYYIYYYNSLNFGYNRTFSGQRENTSMGKNHFAAIYTNEQILTMRKEYVYTPIEKLYEKYGQKEITLYGFKNTLLQSYKNLPIYRKEKKIWIYPPEWKGERLEVNIDSRSGWKGEEEKELDENIQDFSNIILRKIADKGRKLSNYNIILIRLLAIKGEHAPQIIKKIGLEGKISEDIVKRIIKGQAYANLPYYNFDKQWVFPASYNEKQKEKFLRIISTIGDE